MDAPKSGVGGRRLRGRAARRPHRARAGSPPTSPSHTPDPFCSGPRCRRPCYGKFLMELPGLRVSHGWRRRAGRRISAMPRSSRRGSSWRRAGAGRRGAAAAASSCGGWPGAWGRLGALEGLAAAKRGRTRPSAPPGWRSLAHDVSDGLRARLIADATLDHPATSMLCTQIFVGVRSYNILYYSSSAGSDPSEAVQAHMVTRVDCLTFWDSLHLPGARCSRRG